MKPNWATGSNLATAHFRYLSSRSSLEVTIYELWRNELRALQILENKQNGGQKADFSSQTTAKLGNLDMGQPPEIGII